MKACAADSGRMGGSLASLSWCGALLAVFCLCAPSWGQYGLSVPPLEAEMRETDEPPAPPRPRAEPERSGVMAIDAFVIQQDPRISPARAPQDLGLLLDLPVELTLSDGVWTNESGATGPRAPVRISELTRESRLFDASALRAIGRVIEDDILKEEELVAWVTVQRPARPDPGTEEETERVATLLVLVESDPILVDGLTLAFEPSENAELPSAADLLSTEVTFGVTEEGYFVQSEGGRFEEVTLRLDEIEEGSEFLTTGLLEVVRAITDRLRTEEQLIGILVAPSPEQIDLAGRTFVDLREPEVTTLEIRVYLSVVSDFRTLAFGDRVKEENRENAAVHRRLIERSTVKEGDLLRRDQLDEYLQRLNRMPGRRVSAALSAAEDEGVQVDYLVSERRPLLIYGQVSNTGTEQTDRIRYRVGGQLSQILNLDDTLTIDFITAGTSGDTVGYLAQYESDVPGTDRLRYRLEAAYSEFVASDVGLAGEEFTGDSTRVGGGLIWNVYQRGDLFLDLLAGARWQNVSTVNEVVQVDGESDFFVPRVGARLERRSRIAETYGYITAEYNLPGVAGTASEEELEALGRLDVERDWGVLRFGLSHSFFLEPLVNRSAWEDVSTPRSSTLAHEIKLDFRGQAALNGRLIPQEEMVVGGLFTVRGYPESVVSADNVFIASAEYRFHLPRALAYSPSPGEMFGQPFRFRPQEPYGEADWDLVLKAFVDAGWTDNEDRLPFETEDTLVGAGLGVEFSFRRNLFARVDWAMALEDLPENEQSVEVGDSEWHFVITVLF